MSDPELSHEPTPEELQVRRLLAEARHDEPMPADVVARLDRVLADLADTRAPVTRTRHDHDHDAAQRRRHRRRNLVLAAAAVVVLGVGVSRLDLSGSADSSSAGSSADSSVLQEQAEGGGAAGDAPQTPASPLELHRGAFEREVRTYAAQGRLAQDADRATDQGGGTAQESAPSTYDLGQPTCAPVRFGQGRQVPVRYDGEPAVLVVRPASGGRQVVDLYRCGADEPLRSTTVPAG